MTSSILTNASAMTALRVLNSINKDLATTQNRISTGLKVSSAKDNASFWAVSSVMKSDVNSFKAIGDNLSLAENSLSVARTGAEQITKLIDTIKSKTTAAQEGSIDKGALQADIDAALDQISEITKSANFNGVKLLETTSKVRLLSSIGRDGSNVDASYISFTSQDLTFAPRGGLESIAGLSVLDRGDSLVESKTDGVPEYNMGALNSQTFFMDANKFTFDTDNTDNDFTLTYSTGTATSDTSTSAFADVSDGNDLASQLAGSADVVNATWDNTEGLTVKLANGYDFSALSVATGAGITAQVDDSVVYTAKAGQQVTFNYVDEEGVNRTLTHTLQNNIVSSDDGALALVDELNGNEDFADLFRISFDNGEFKISAKDRETDVELKDWSGPMFTTPGDVVTFAPSSYNLDTDNTDNDFVLTYRDLNGSLQTSAVADVDATALGTTATALAGTNFIKNASWDSTNGLTMALEAGYEFVSMQPTAAATGEGVTFASEPTFEGMSIVERNEMSFQDQPLRLGEEITLNYTVNGTQKEVVLRVTGQDTDTGARLDDQSNPNRIELALDAREVTHASTTGSKIVEEIVAALQGGNLPSSFGLSNDSASAPSFGTNLYYTNNNNTITFETAGTGIDSLDVTGLPITDYDQLLDNLEEAMQVATDAAAALGSAQGRIEIQKDFIMELTDNLEEGIGTLVDANMNEESARLQALQVQQQLGIQSLSIANQAPQALLSLFQ
ncbi:Flagellin protein FlaA [Caenispirillum salinarum AK4]|uniref:Flagellin n=1 Tax=Caenispirillum salinarum AK4 TaxID=1238182 RepID=K9GPD1_9PROT|nr:flagellin [Caenispirillum salinarum]EKV26549.1 Flagellin protein FlaA [Caenispirillum salinarum AK4]